MDIPGYRAFLAVAEHRSFSKAADSLFITQPAISKRVAQLEAQLGRALFDRVGRKVSLNEAGNALLPVAMRIIQEVQESRRVINNLSGEISGKLPLVTSHHIGLRRLPSVLKRFTRKYPKVRLDLAFMDSENACRKIEQGHFELGVVTLPLVTPKTLKLTSLWSDPLAIATTASHPLAIKSATQKSKITLDDLADYPAILPSVGTYTRSIIEDPIIKKQAALDVILETNYLETIRMMVSIGLGWSALPRTMINKELIEIPISGLHIQRELGIVQHAERSLSNASKAFIEEALIKGTAD
ncbi:MAG: LysR family transcriptional regulator [Thiotrichaceae bacterium]